MTFTFLLQQEHETKVWEHEEEAEKLNQKMVTLEEQLQEVCVQVAVCIRILFSDL